MRLIFGLWGMMQGCAPSLEKEWDWNNEGSEEIEDKEEVRVIDATSYEEWVYLDLEQNILVDVENSEASFDWDIGFMRYHVKLNSGIHGPSTVQALVVEGEDFDSYNEIPLDGYQEDQPDGNDDEIPEYVLSQWYEYDPETHILTPADIFYIVKNRNDVFYKFQVQSYYNEAGSSGHMTIYWEEVIQNDEVQ